MKNKLYLISGIAASIIIISFISFNLLTSDHGEIKFTYQIDSFKVPTTIVNGSINKITKHNDTNSILIEMNSSNQGYLIIQIPKTMLKALNDDYSKFYFFVISDGKETSYEQIDSETIKINFKKYTKKIEIAGASRLN